MDWSIIDPMVKRVARSVSRAYSSWVTTRDTESELWVWALKNERRIVEYLNSTTPSEFNRLMGSILNTEARTYAIKERATMTGYDPSDLEWYTPRSVRAILPEVFDVEDWQSFETSYSGMPTNKPLANASGDRLATILDIRAALASLQEDQVTILRMFYGEGMSVEVCAIYFDIESEAARKRIDRAVYAIADRLNTPRQGDQYEATTGQWDTRGKGRRAMSNAAARKKTNAGWDE